MGGREYLALILKFHENFTFGILVAPFLLSTRRVTSLLTKRSGSLCCCCATSAAELPPGPSQDLDLDSTRTVHLGTVLAGTVLGQYPLVDDRTVLDFGQIQGQYSLEIMYWTVPSRKFTKFELTLCQDVAAFLGGSP